MYNDFWINNVLIPLSGIFWIATYLLIIKRGFQDRTYGMPLAALCANFSWEILFGFIYPDMYPMNIVNQAWCIMDVLIVYQYLKYGLTDYPKNLSIKWHIPVFIISFFIAFGIVFFMYHELKDYEGAYSAWGMNLVASILFITMLLRRNNISGQSIYIGIFKLLGTFFMDIAQYRLTPENNLLTFLYFSILIFDLAYIALYYKKAKEQGINPWMRI